MKDSHILNNEDKSINSLVSFAHGHIPEILRKLENYLGVSLSMRSTSGQVVCKTKYFNGPCSIIRGTERGNLRCRKAYKNIEDRLFRRKVPFVNVCYAGFLIFAVPLEFRGEMVGTLFGSQVLPIRDEYGFDLETFFGHTVLALDIHDSEAFYKSFKNVRKFTPNIQRINFLQYLSEIGDNFTKMAFADKSWEEFLREMRLKTPNFGKV